MNNLKKNNQFYLTFRKTASGMFRAVLVWNGTDFVRKGLYSEAEAREFVKWSEKHGVSFVATPNV